jgi:hypothetical protein
VTNPAIKSGDYEVVQSGKLTNIRPHTDGRSATLTHPEVQLHLIFPAGMPDPDPIVNDAWVTIGGTYAGETIQVEAVFA